MIKIKFEPPIIQAIPLSPDDLIEIQAISSTYPVILDLEGSFYNEQGNIVSFQQSLLISAGVTLTTARFRLGYKFLLSAVLHTRTSSIPDGSCYCRMSLCKSESGGVFPYRKILSQGYVSTYSSIGYGSASIQGAPSDHFFTENIIIADPGAGNDAQHVVPSFTQIIIQSITGTFTSNAVASNRFLRLLITLPPANDQVFTFNSPQPASYSSSFVFAPGLSDLPFSSISIAKVAIPILLLTNGSTITLTSVGFDAGDTFTNIALLIKRKTIPY